jgi:hypothetical protein
MYIVLKKRFALNKLKKELISDESFYKLCVTLLIFSGSISILQNGLTEENNLPTCFIKVIVMLLSKLHNIFNTNDECFLTK